MENQRPLIESWWWAGVDAVRGDVAVRNALADRALPAADQIIAVGKAATAMVNGALSVWSHSPKVLVVTKYGHAADAGADWEVHETAHPVPDQASLNAGQALLDCVASLGVQESLLFLVSGGASSLAETLVGGKTLADLQALNQFCLAQGFDIHEINRRRGQISQIKNGNLLARFGGASLTVVGLSDVEGDSIEVIGSGIGSPAKASENVDLTGPIMAGSNAVARAAVAAAVVNSGHNVVDNRETLYGDVPDIADQIAARLHQGPPGVYIFGGEPTIILPDNPGRGGRNQALALAIGLRGKDLSGSEILVAGTDGTDGPTDAAGGFAPLGQPADIRTRMQSAFQAADAYPVLSDLGCLFTSGPTGTNVMDLLIAMKR